MKDLGTTHPVEMDGESHWETITDMINNGQGVGIAELMRRKRELEANPLYRILAQLKQVWLDRASPEVVELIARVKLESERKMPEVPPEVQEDVWRHTIIE